MTDSNTPDIDASSPPTPKRSGRGDPLERRLVAGLVATGAVLTPFLINDLRDEIRNAQNPEQRPETVHNRNIRLEREEQDQFYKLLETLTRYSGESISSGNLSHPHPRDTDFYRYRTCVEEVLKRPEFNEGGVHADVGKDARQSSMFVHYNDPGIVGFGAYTVLEAHKKGGQKAERAELERFIQDSTFFMKNSSASPAYRGITSMILKADPEAIPADVLEGHETRCLQNRQNVELALKLAHKQLAAMSPEQGIAK